MTEILEIKMTEIDYIKCLYCGNTKPIHRKKGDFEFKAMDIEPSEFQVIQIREASAGPGRRHRGKGVGGFKVIGGLSIREALADPKYKALAVTMKGRLIQIVNSYIEAGIIRKEEIGVK